MTGLEIAGAASTEALPKTFAELLLRWPMEDAAKLSTRWRVTVVDVDDKYRAALVYPGVEFPDDSEVVFRLDDGTIAVLPIPHVEQRGSRSSDADRKLWLLFKSTERLAGRMVDVWTQLAGAHAASQLPLDLPSTEEVPKGEYTWDLQPNPESMGRHRGDEHSSVILSGDNPEHEWIANTMTRRWLASECICGCGQASEGGEDRGLDPFLHPDCRERFIERLRRADANAPERFAAALLNPAPMDGREFGNTVLTLQEVYRTLSRADLQTSLAEQRHQLESEIARAAQQMAEAQRELDRLRQAGD